MPALTIVPPLYVLGPVNVNVPFRTLVSEPPPLRLPAYVEVNHGFERLSGWTRPEVIGRSSADLDLWADAAERDAFYAELAGRGHIQGFLSRFRRRGGGILGAGLAKTQHQGDDGAGDRQGLRVHYTLLRS